MIRVAILGCARIARRSLAPAFDRHGAYMLTAVASRTPEKAKAFASAFGARACSYEEAVSSGNVDLVYCPLPTGLHYEWVKRALENGKHVLCEKSLTCSPAQTLRLVELARQAGVLLMESFQFRFHAQNVFVRDFIAAGALGRILSVEARFSFPRLPDPADIRFDRALGGGGLLDAGAYAVKASSYLLGKGLSVVSAEVKRDAMSPVDIAGSCVLRRTDGVESHASYSMDAAYCCGYTVAFEKGSVSTTRAFTARDDYSAEVCIRTEAGEDVRTFVDDHFARLLDYVSERIAAREFEEEYSECLEQARLQGEVARLGGYDTVNRYAVFGSNGYLASQIRSYLDGRGVAYDEFDLPEADVTSDAFWRTFDPARYSAVLFFAGLAGPAASNAKKDLYGRVNVGGLGNLLSMLAPFGPCAPKVVFPSTRLVYKGSDTPLGEEARKEARSVYAQNKLDCESLLSKCHDESDVPYVVLRLCVPYGSLVSHDYSYGTVGLFFRQAKDGTITLYGDGSQRRTFTHVADFCRIVAEMAANGETGVFNVGGESRSLMEVAQAIADRTGARVACIPWPPEALALESGSTVFDSSKLDAIVGSDYRTIDDLSKGRGCKNQEAERDDRLHEPEFSVIIPVYNVAAYLRECLDSIRAQTFTDWEAICVDHGSTDESGAILDEYAATDNRFTVIHQENRGVNFARQKALEAAKGVWIASVDSDDWIDKDYFKEVHRALDGSGCEFAWCDYYTVKNGTVTRRHQPYSTEPEKLQVGLLDTSIWGGNVDKFFARKFLVANNVSFYCEDRVLACEDALFNCKVFSFRPIAKYIPFSGYYYRIRSGSLAHSSITISRLRSWTIVTNEFLKYALTDEVVACVRYQEKIIKAYVYSAPSIPNNVFYNLYPDIRSLKGHTIALRHKILFWLAVRGLRTPVLWFCALSRKILKKDSH